jgi:CRISPR/Cas system type I-B associated protein Csh2 (Cas7 group RAMP superfamily)
VEQLPGPFGPVVPQFVKSAAFWKGPIRFEYATDLDPVELVAVTAEKTKRASTK